MSCTNISFDGKGKVKNTTLFIFLWSFYNILKFTTADQPQDSTISHSYLAKANTPVLANSSSFIADGKDDTLRTQTI